MATVLHPNGFIQHDLPSGDRLHVWAPDLPVAQTVRTPLHDHTFTFTSRVLLGELVHEEWSTTCEPGDEPTHDIYAVEGPLLVPTGVQTKAFLAHAYVFGQGTEYEFGGPGRYHDSRGYGLTATVMHKTATGLAEHPNVLVPVGQRPDNDFRRDQYPEEHLLEWVDRVLRRMAPCKVG